MASSARCSEADRERHFSHRKSKGGRCTSQNMQAAGRFVRMQICGRLRCFALQSLLLSKLLRVPRANVAYESRDDRGSRDGHDEPKRDRRGRRVGGPKR